MSQRKTRRTRGRRPPDKRLGIRHKTRAEIIKIARNAGTTEEIRPIIKEVAQNKPDEISLLKRLRSIEKRLQSSNTGPAASQSKRRVLETTRTPVKKTQAKNCSRTATNISPRCTQVIKALSRMKAPDVVRLWRNCLAEAKRGSNPNRRADAITILDWIRHDWERRLHEQDYFVWPRTEAERGDGSLDADDWLEEGLLKYVGYTVGRTNGAPKSLRHLILTELFEGPVLPAFPADYLAKWGRSGTPARLKQLAETLAAFTRNAKRRRNAAMEDAIREWESDLGFLYNNFYVGRFLFAWPLPT